jgi:creatinine amidohydrolase
VLGDVELEIFSERDDHAGEMETSFGLAYFPHLVAKNADGSLAADAGTIAPTRFEAIEKGWVSITRPWHLLTTNSGAGNPHGATADKARRMMDVIVERISKFLVELSAAELDERFPF